MESSSSVRPSRWSVVLCCRFSRSLDPSPVPMCIARSGKVQVVPVLVLHRMCEHTVLVNLSVERCTLLLGSYCSSSRMLTLALQETLLATSSRQ